MHRSGANGDGESLKGNRLTQVHLEGWSLDECGCVVVCAGGEVCYLTVVAV